MHISSFNRMKYLLEWYKEYWDSGDDNIEILDIGSYDQNGTQKGLFEDKRYSYTGLDMVEGPNVDIVPKDVYSWEELENNKYDLVISGQVFEHIEYPWLTIKEIERILKPSGIVIIIAPNSGFEHKAPYDCYRYYADGLKALASWANLFVLHASVAGVPDINSDDTWVSEWNDAVIVAQKTPYDKGLINQPFTYEKRMISNAKYITKYVDIPTAIDCIKKQYYDERFIIFGAGQIGKQVGNILGSESILCYLDNDEKKDGLYLNGAKINNYCKNKGLCNNRKVIVAVSDRIAPQIHKMLKDDGISTISIYAVEE